MTDAELQRIFRRAGHDLDRRQRERLRDLKAYERNLYDALVVSLLGILVFRDGRIQSRVTDKAVDRAIAAAMRSVPTSTLQRTIASDLRSIVKGQDAYYSALMKEEGRAGYSAVRDRVTSRTMRQMGIGERGPIRGGYVSRVFVTTAATEAIRSVVSAAIAGRSTQPQLLKLLKTTVTGTRSRDGIVTEELGETLVDTYTQVDRNASTGYGQALKFKWFTYEGGLIETSRQFCVSRDGKVFNTVEAEEWRHDPELPRTKKEKESGVVTGYTPVANLANTYGASETSMGRWRCRHRVRFVSEQMAKRLAPERFN